MPRKPEMPAETMLQLSLPGNIRLQMAAYIPNSRQYHPIPKFSARVAVDSVAQARELWKALVLTIEAVVSGSAGKPVVVYPGWAPIGDEVVEGFGIEVVDESEASDG